MIASRHAREENEAASHQAPPPSAAALPLSGAGDRVYRQSAGMSSADDECTKMCNAWRNAPLTECSIGCGCILTICLLSIFFSVAFSLFFTILSFTVGNLKRCAESEKWLGVCSDLWTFLAVVLCFLACCCLFAMWCRTHHTPETTPGFRRDPSIAQVPPQVVNGVPRVVEFRGENAQPLSANIDQVG